MATVDPASGGGSAPLRKMPSGRYRDFLPIGAGGMGVVYRARDVDLDRDVALKVVRPGEGTGTAGVTPPVPGAGAMRGDGRALAETLAALRERFLDEARITGGLAHPGIVPVYEVGETEDGVPYYTMRLVEGRRTLADAIEETQGRPFEERLRLLDPFLRLCDTVRYAHARGVVHRDLKPRNVALGDYGEVIVLDWGLASAAGRPSSRPAAASSSPFLGTPGYMAPEATGDGAPADARADVYSLGAVLLEVLTGRPPSPASPEAPDPSASEPALPRDLVAICRRALAPRPADRLGDVDALAQGVRAWQERTIAAREADALAAQAEAVLAGAEGLPLPEALGLADRALAVSAEALRRVPGHAGAEHVAARARALRERTVVAREARVRRRTLRRAGVVALAATALAAVGVAWALEVRRAEADSLRALAQGERRRAEDAMSFMLSDLRTGLEALGRLDLLSEAAEVTRRYYETLPAALSSRADRERRVAALEQVGDVFRARGDLARALASYRVAADDAEGLLREDPVDPRLALTAARARALVGRALFDRGERAAAFDVARVHLAEVERLRAEVPDDESVLDEVSPAHAFLGDALLRQGQDAAGLDHYREALRAAAERSGARPGDPVARERAVQARVTLARWTEDPQAALGLLDEALAEATSLSAKRPGETRWRHLAAEVLAHRLAPLSQLGRDAEVTTTFAEALAIRDDLERLDPANALWREARVRLHLRMVDALSKGSAANAAILEQAERAVVLAEDLVRRDPENAVWLHQLVNAADRLGFQRRATDDRPGMVQAGARAYDAASRLRARDGTNPVWRHIYAHNACAYGFALSLAEDHARAVPLLREGLDLFEQILVAGADLDLENHRVSWATRLAISCGALGDRAGAEAGRRRAMAYSETVATGPRSTPRWRALFAQQSDDLARLLLDAVPPRPGEARGLYARAIDVLRPAATGDGASEDHVRLLRSLEAARDALAGGR